MGRGGRAEGRRGSQSEGGSSKATKKARGPPGKASHAPEWEDSSQEQGTKKTVQVNPPRVKVGCVGSKRGGGESRKDGRTRVERRLRMWTMKKMIMRGAMKMRNGMRGGGREEKRPSVA